MKQIVNFALDVRKNGAIKFVAGQYYALDALTQSLVDSGHAALINARLASLTREATSCK